MAPKLLPNIYPLQIYRERLFYKEQRHPFLQSSSYLSVYVVMWCEFQMSNSKTCLYLFSDSLNFALLSFATFILLCLFARLFLIDPQIVICCLSIILWLIFSFILSLTCSRSQSSSFRCACRFLACSIHLFLFRLICSVLGHICRILRLILLFTLIYRRRLTRLLFLRCVFWLCLFWLLFNRCRDLLLLHLRWMILVLLRLLGVLGPFNGGLLESLDLAAQVVAPLVQFQLLVL